MKNVFGIMLLMMVVFLACSTERGPVHTRDSSVSEAEWRAVENQIKVSISENSFYADSITEPKSLEVVYMATDAPYFCIVFAAKTNSLWYLYRYVGVLSNRYCFFTTIGKMKDTLVASEWRYLEEDISSGNLATLFDGNLTSREQLDWARVIDCFRASKPLYGLGCDGVEWLRQYRELIISDTSLNEKELGGLVIIDVPRHLRSRINKLLKLKGDDSIRLTYETSIVDFPWFAELLKVQAGEEEYESSIIGYVGESGISYRIAPEFSELIDSITSGLGSNISSIRLDEYEAPRMDQLDARAMSRMYESYEIGPDDDTLYSGEAGQ